MLCLLLAGCASAPRSRATKSELSRSDGPRVLAVIAHPDDECAFAATLYKITTFLGGACDLVVITDGEGGFKFSTLAEPIYGLELSDEAIGRAELPAIRRREMLDAAKLLQLRDVEFLDQQDHRYTTDIAEVLGSDAHVWDLGLVRRALSARLAAERYDFVFALAPTPDTHAHHQAATALAAEAMLALPAHQRPVMLIAQTRFEDSASPLIFAPEESGVTVGPFVFDRTQKFGYQQKLDYRVVVNWAIAAHKSQGTMQLAMNQGEREEFFLFGDRNLEASKKAAALFEALRGAQFPAKTYAASAGTNAGDVK